MLLNDLEQYLLAHGVDEGGIWPLRRGSLASQDRAIGLFSTGGQPPDTLGRETQLVTFQLRVRGGKYDYDAAQAKWQECFSLLQDAQQTDDSPPMLPGVVFIQAMGDGELQFNDGPPGGVTGRQEWQGRPNFTSNFRVKRYRT